MPRSHRSPAYPGTHAHDHRCEHAANVHKPSRHEPPLRHGEDAHSCLSAHTVWLPPLGTVSYPGWHVHSCVPGPTCMQVARKASQLFSALVQGSVSTSQSVPPQDEVHVHTYAATISVHVPALPHGNEAHSSWSCSQTWSAKPAEQVHANACTRSKHVPPCKHGADAHSSTSASQSAPPYPFTHAHVYCEGNITVARLDAMHVLPCWHGCDAHSSIPSPQLTPL